MSEPNVTPEPRYQAMRRRIHARIRRGEWTVGDRIPGERELAREAGVSQMTVNRAIGDLVREGVLVRRVGSGTYVTETSVRSQARPGIAMVTRIAGHPEEDLYLRTPFAAVRAIAAQQGCHLAVSQIEDADLPDVADRHPDLGLLVVAPGAGSRDTLDRMHDAGVPFVVMGASWSGARFACVDSDNVAGMQTAVNYLARLGHRRIAFVNGETIATNCIDRLAGYASGMQANGLDVDPAWIVEADSSWDVGTEAGRALTELLVGPDHVTAVACAGYMLTLSTISLVGQLQLRVPDDVSVIGFDDQPSAEYLQPPLTTVRQPLYALGERAILRLLDLVRSPCADRGGVEKLPVDLIVRASCRRL